MYAVNVQLYHRNRIYCRYYTSLIILYCSKRTIKNFKMDLPTNRIKKKTYEQRFYLCDDDNLDLE